MVKQWKKSLEQSDILSDGTAFRGSAIPNTGTIPNTDQVGQGVDWASKTPSWNSGRTSDPNVDIVSVSGSGYITGIFAGTNSGDYELRVEIDGVQKFNDAVDSMGEETRQGVLPSIHRFEDSFAVGSGADPGAAAMSVAVSWVSD